VNVEARIWKSVARVLVVLSGVQTVLLSIQTKGLVFGHIADVLSN
jgi:hypothetical protein